MKDLKCEPEVNKNVSHCANEGSPFSEIRKSLDILEDVFSDLPDKDDSPGTQDPNHAGSDTSKDSMPFTANELLQLLSKGGITTKDQPETASDLSEVITGCKSTSDVLLQLVHTDHPYLCKTQEADDTEDTPVKSGSCSSIPDPEIIHDFFLHTTNMISYQPIGGAPEVGGVPVPSPAPTLIGSPHLTYKTNPDSQCASSENISGCGGLVGERQTEKSELKFTSSGESEKSEVLSDKTRHQKLGQTSVEDSDKSKELKQRDCSDKNPTEGDSEPYHSRTNEESKDIKKNLKSSNSKDVSENGQSNNDQEMKHVFDKTLQAVESSVFSNMVQPTSLNQIDPNSWTAACKAMADKVQEESLIHCAVSLLLKVWTDYLSLTFEEVRAREIQVAQENNYTDDVIAMIEDRDRYVWQLIEEMEPRHFMIDI